MKFFSKILCLITFLGSSFVLNAQTNQNLELANQHFSKKEYPQAIELYNKLYSKNQLPDLSNYIKALQANSELDDAEKILKKELKKDPENIPFLIELGYNYTLLNEHSKAKKEYEKALKEVPSSPNRVKNIGDLFLSKNETEFAIKTYENAKKNDPGEYSFYLELSYIYKNQNKLPEVFNQLLSLLKLSEAYLQPVEHALLLNLSTDDNSYDKLTTEILRHIQKNPNDKAFSELLIWNYIQQKKFTAAYLQAKAIDKRFKEDGIRIFEIAKICASNGSYENAIDAFNYVIEKGKNSYYYYDSKKNLLEIYNKKITDSNYTDNDLKELETLYQKAILDLGNSYRVVSVLKDYALLQAFYLNQPKIAIITLQNALTTPNIQKTDKANVKIAQADVLVFINEVWESSLLYSQVEKDFEEHPIGHIAKLKNAKLSFYRGEFKWAQAQLDALKSSTSKLIANDALELSLLIQDNLVDSNTFALEAFAKADLLTYQNKNEDAIVIFDTLLASNPQHSLADDIYYKKAQIARKNRNYEEAAKNYNIIITNYKNGILADNALFELAELNELYLNNGEKAQELYKNILLDYPGSIFVVEARKKYRTLRGDNLN